MSHEIYWVYTGASVLYAQVRQGKQTNRIWNTSGTPAFENYSTANIADYDIALTQQGTGSSFYSGDFPTGITTPGLYLITIHERAGGSPAESDPILSIGDLHWNGAEARPVADTMWMNTGSLDTAAANVTLQSLTIDNSSNTAQALYIYGGGDGSSAAVIKGNSAGALQLLSDSSTVALSISGGLDIARASGNAVSIYSADGEALNISTDSTSASAVSVSNNGDEGYGAVRCVSTNNSGLNLEGVHGVYINGTDTGVYIGPGSNYGLRIPQAETTYAVSLGKVQCENGVYLGNSEGPGLSVTSSHTSGYAAEVSSSTCGGLSVISSASAGSAVLLQNNSTTTTVMIENNNGVALTIDSASDSAVELIASTYAIETADTIKCASLLTTSSSTLAGLTISGTTAIGALTISSGITLTGGASLSGTISVYGAINMYNTYTIYANTALYGTLYISGVVTMADGLLVNNTDGPGIRVTSTHTSGYAFEIKSDTCGGVQITGGDDEPCIKIEHESPSSALPGAIDINGEVFFRSEPYGYVESSPTPADDAFDGYNGNLSSVDDFYNGMFLVFQSGSLAGQARQISDYVGSTQSFAFNGSGTDLDRPFTAAPSTDNRFIILGLAKG